MFAPYCRHFIICYFSLPDLCRNFAGIAMNPTYLAQLSIVCRVFQWMLSNFENFVDNSKRKDSFGSGAQMRGRFYPGRGTAGRTLSEARGRSLNFPGASRAATEATQSSLHGSGKSDAWSVSPLRNPSRKASFSKKCYVCSIFLTLG